MMNPIEKAKSLVYNYAEAHLCPTDNVDFSFEDVYVVWFCYILGGWKALCSTNLPDGMYYEVTYDKDKKTSYVDAYKKFDQEVIEE